MFKKIFFIATALLMTSCVPLKETVYLQTENEQTTREYKLQNQEYRIGSQDILQISVQTVEQNSYLPEKTGVAQATEVLLYIKGYGLNDQGEITLPLLGQIYVLGKTVDEVRNELQAKVDKLYNGATVTVNLSGIRVSVLGEVNMPGKYIYYQNRVSILEALASAGDLTTVGNRKNIRVIRHGKDEARVNFVDLTKEEIISSDYYYLQPNDVVYVEPLEVKTWGIGEQGFTSLVAVLSAVSSTLLIINLLKN